MNTYGEEINAENLEQQAKQLSIADTTDCPARRRRTQQGLRYVYS